MSKYYYVDAQGQQQGPVELDELKNIGLTPGTLVWTEGMDSWRAVAKVAEVAPFVVVQAPAVPPTASVRVDAPQPMTEPHSWLWLGIVSTILCCAPFGIVSIVFASKVSRLWSEGKYDEALESSKKAKIWGIVAAAVGVAFWLISIILFIIEVNSDSYYDPYDYYYY